MWSVECSGSGGSGGAGASPSTVRGETMRGLLGVFQEVQSIWDSEALLVKFGGERSKGTEAKEKKQRMRIK